MVTARGLTQDAEITFIVSESASVPSWNSVEENPAKLVRTFSNTQPQREVYFSATDQLPLDSPLLASGSNTISVDLSADPDGGVADGGVADGGVADGGVAGVMNPRSQYYVHAYAEARHIASSEPIITANYPQALPAQYDSSTQGVASDQQHSIAQFSWGMQMWDRGDRTPATYAGFPDKRQRHTIEVRKGEFALLAERFMLPVDAEDSASSWSVCPNSAKPIMRISYALLSIYEHTGAFTGGTADLSRLRLVVTDRNTTTRIFGSSWVPAVLFQNTSEITANKRDEVDDLMISSKSLIDQLLSKPAVTQNFARDGLVLILSKTSTCFNSSYGYGFKDEVLGVVRVVTQ